jgi:hypothetical protein
MGEVASLIPLLQGGMQAASSYQEGQATKMVAGINAKYANMQGQEALRIGEQNAGRRMLQGGQDASSAAAQFVGGNIRADKGSAAQTQEDIKNAAIVDAQTIRTNAAKQAWGYGVEATNFKNQGRFAEIKGYSDAAQSIIGGGMRYAYDQYSLSKYGNKKPPGSSDASYEGD